MTIWVPPQLLTLSGIGAALPAALQASLGQLAGNAPVGALLSTVGLPTFLGVSGARRVRAIVTINGMPISGVFWEKLISLTIQDHEGTKSDTIDFSLEDGPPHLAIPQHDDKIRCWLGYEDGVMDYMGLWSVNDVDLDCLPWKMQIKGNATDMVEKTKEHATKHWDEGTTLGDVAKWVGGFAGVAV
jgi:hypothetical protein